MNEWRDFLYHYPTNLHDVILSYFAPVKCSDRCVTSSRFQDVWCITDCSNDDDEQHTKVLLIFTSCDCCWSEFMFLASTAIDLTPQYMGFKWKTVKKHPSKIKLFLWMGLPWGKWVKHSKTYYAGFSYEGECIFHFGWYKAMRGHPLYITRQ